MTRLTLLRAGVVTIALVTTTACGKQASRADTTADPDASQVPAPQTVDVRIEPAVPDSERAFGTVIVSNAKPNTGDSVVQITRRTRVELPGAASAFTIEGVSGAAQHSFLVALDSAGAVMVVTHKWHNADNSVVAQTDCGARTKCPERRVGADAKSGTVLFTRLELKGLDGNTAQEATSTLTGAIP